MSERTNTQIKAYAKWKEFEEWMRFIESAEEAEEKGAVR